MNEHFVCIKVDREERPDVDAIYMEAVQAMTGHGGWPLTAFLDAGRTPFYGGTYFPPEPRHGHAELRDGAGGRGRVMGDERERRSRSRPERIRERLAAHGTASGRMRRRRSTPRCSTERRAPC